MRIFRARVKEKNGAAVEPEFLASDEFCALKDPKEYLTAFWGLEDDDVESYELFEVVDGKEVAL